MNIAEFQIQLDLNAINEKAILEKHCCQINDNNWLFVDSGDGKCWLFDSNGKMLDIKKLRHIRNDLFYEDDDLKCIVIPDLVTSIGNWAFSYCYELTSIVIPNSVTSIGEFAFYGCTGLTSVMISDSMTSIGEGAFAGCSVLTSVIIPDSVTSIGLGAFYECINIKNLIFKSKTMDQVKKMHNYPWGIKDKSIIKAKS